MIVYLHGFNSAFTTDSRKIAELSKIDEVIGVNYDSFSTFNEIFDYLYEKCARDFDDPVFVGTSLGGFWAAQMAKAFGRPSVIINPSVAPNKGLAKHVGVNMKNYQTLEERVMAPHVPDSYEGKSIDKIRFRLLPLVLLDEADEVIDAKETSELLSSFPKLMFEGGNHRFEHMEEAMPKVRSYLNHCSYVDQMNV